MPGIVGIVTKMPRARAEQELLRMLGAVRHESLESGTWIDESLGVYVGWTARQKCFSARMPLRNERGDMVLVFSGEEFPDPDTIANLKMRGHDISDDESSYLVHLSEENPNFPENLNGRFHGILLDQKHAKANLFNDRYGIHRDYYHESRAGFYFAAEAKAILA